MTTASHEEAGQGTKGQEGNGDHQRSLIVSEWLKVTESDGAMKRWREGCEVEYRSINDEHKLTKISPALRRLRLKEVLVRGHSFSASCTSTGGDHQKCKIQSKYLPALRAGVLPLAVCALRSIFLPSLPALSSRFGPWIDFS